MVDGLPGDIVALALPLDIMKIQEAGLIKDGWQVGLPCGFPSIYGRLEVAPAESAKMLWTLS